jgi:hypothetical protein
MREIRQSGSVRGVRSNPYPYRDFPLGRYRSAFVATKSLPWKDQDVRAARQIPQGKRI